MIDRMGEVGEAASCRTFVHILVALSLVGLMAPTVSLAQMPPDIAATIAGMGRVIDQEATGKLYAPLQVEEPYAFVKVSRDVKIWATRAQYRRYLCRRLRHWRPAGADVRAWRRLHSWQQARSRQPFLRQHYGVRGAQRHGRRQCRILAG